MKELSLLQHVSEEQKGFVHILKALANQGLSGRVFIPTAGSRRSPIGLPIMTPTSEDETPFSQTIALYVPTVKDKDLGDVLEIQQRANRASEHVYQKIKSRAKKEGRINMYGGIMVVTNDQLAHWNQHKLTPPTAERKPSSFSEEDRRAMRKRNEEFFKTLLTKTLRSMSVLGKELLLPSDLLDRAHPVRKIGGRTGLAVRVASFTNPDYERLRDLVHRRDGGNCQALNAALLGSLNEKDIAHLGELPICGETTVDNYFGSIGPARTRIVPGKDTGELNHIFTQGDTAVLMATAIFLGLIPKEIYMDSNKLLFFQSCVNLRGLIRKQADKLERAKIEDIIKVFVPALQYAIRAVNRMENIENVSLPCHRGSETGGYHIDMHYPSLVRLMADINNGAERIPMEEAAFNKWVDQKVDQVLNDTYPPVDLRNGREPIDEIRTFRAMASVLAETPYVDTDIQAIWARMNRKKTARFALDIEYEKSRQYQEILEEFEIGEGADESEIPQVLNLLEQMGLVRDGVDEEFSVQPTGRTGKALLKSLGIEPIKEIPVKRNGKSKKRPTTHKTKRLPPKKK